MADVVVPDPPEFVQIACPYSGDNGKLHVLGQDGLGFDVRRVFWLSGVPPGAALGDHAHRRGVQVLVPMSGHWRVRIEGGPGRESVTDVGEERAIAVVVHPWNWIRLLASSRLDVMAVLCSEPYDPESYVRDRAEWERAVGR